MIEFLEPVDPNLPKAEFLAKLTEVIEQRTAELVAEARGGAVVPATLIPDPDKGTLAVAPTKSAA